MSHRQSRARQPLSPPSHRHRGRLAAGAEVVVDGKVVGALTSVAPTELPTGALGYVRREIEPPSAVELRWDGGSARAVI